MALNDPKHPSDATAPGPPVPPRGRGRVLAVKLGVNPNSSSLGADVTFLLLGATALSVLTPVLGALARLRWRREPRPPMTPLDGTAGPDGATVPDGASVPDRRA